MPQQTLVRSRFVPARGGYAPGDLRTAFLDAFDAFAEWEDGDPEPMVEVRGQAVPVSKVCGLLWNCTDVLADRHRSGFGFVDEDLEGSTTYAQAARRLKFLISLAQA